MIVPCIQSLNLVTIIVHREVVGVATGTFPPVHLSSECRCPPSHPVELRAHFVYNTLELTSAVERPIGSTPWPILLGILTTTAFPTTGYQPLASAYKSIILLQLKLWGVYCCAPTLTGLGYCSSSEATARSTTFFSLC